MPPPDSLFRHSEHMAFHLLNFIWLLEWPLSPRWCTLHHHGGVSPTRLIGRDSSASWLVSDGFLPPDFPSFDELARNAELLTLVCSCQSVPTRTTCWDTTSLIKDLQVTICVRGPTVLPYLLRTPEPWWNAPKTVYQLNYIWLRVFLSFLVCLNLDFIIILYFVSLSIVMCKSQLRYGV